MHHLPGAVRGDLSPRRQPDLGGAVAYSQRSGRTDTAGHRPVGAGAAPDPPQFPARLPDRGAWLVHIPVDLRSQGVELGESMPAALDLQRKPSHFRRRVRAPDASQLRVEGRDEGWQPVPARRTGAARASSRRRGRADPPNTDPHDGGPVSCSRAGASARPPKPTSRTGPLRRSSMPAPRQSTHAPRPSTPIVIPRAVPSSLLSHHNFCINIQLSGLQYRGRQPRTTPATRYSVRSPGMPPRGRRASAARFRRGTWSSRAGSRGRTSSTGLA